jgi:peptidase A4-like protein
VKRLLLLSICGACALGATSSAARTPAPQAHDLRLGVLNRVGAATDTETSSNWAGYAVTHRRPFTSVTGRWVQPAATCGGPDPTFSGFWLGLGGFAPDSFAVEQAGTFANCVGGTPSYRAWYELYPAPPVYLRLAVRPGDLLSATVSVKGKTVLVRLKNVTTDKLFTKKLRMSRPDLGSAEWVAEAPTGCDYVGTCSTLPLTNFGTVAFSRASATIKGHKGRISDPIWAATSIELHGELDSPPQAGANAIPGGLGPDGGSFAITWQELPPPAGTQP